MIQEMGSTAEKLMGTTAEKLHRRRRAAGLSQTELSEASGVAQSTIASIERGKHTKPHPKTLRKLATGLGVKITDLLED
jgi:transcriptional regulator with XRE-family HTH domain